MKHISILVPETAVPASIVDPRYMFMAVNDHLKSTGKPYSFDVKLVGLSREVKLEGGMFSIHADLLIDEVEKTDLIIVPAVSGDVETALKLNEGFVDWIVRQHENGAEAASLCIGAFLLASTGLLNGKQCSTHWFHAAKFRSMFPEVTLVDDKVITDQNGIYSSGGASSYWNLLLYLVEKYTDREAAIFASKFFLLDFGRNSQAPFVIFKGQKDHEDDIVVNAQEFIERNYQDRITIDDLCEKFGLSRRTFERRFKKATRNTVSEYIQRVKIEAAKMQLESGQKTVNEVVYDVGYNDLKSFRHVFRKITGLSPIDYKNKYNRAVVA